MFGHTLLSDCHTPLALVLAFDLVHTCTPDASSKELSAEIREYTLRKAEAKARADVSSSLWFIARLLEGQEGGGSCRDVSLTG